MPRTPKKDYEPVSREKWVEFRLREYDSNDVVANKDNKRDLHRQVLKLTAKACLGVGFKREFHDRRDALRRSGKSLTEAYRTAIVEFAQRIPTHQALVDDGTYTAFEQKRLTSQRYKEDREIEKRVSLTRLELHEKLAGKKGSKPDIEWVAENLHDEVDILALDPADIPSRVALNMLETAIKDKPRFWDNFDKHQVKIMGRTLLSDSGRSHEVIAGELLAGKAAVGEMEFAGVASVVGETADDADNGT